MRIDIDPELHIGWGDLTVVSVDTDLGLIVSVKGGSWMSLLRWIGVWEDQGLEPPITQKEVYELEDRVARYLKENHGAYFSEFEGLFVNRSGKS